VLTGQALQLSIQGGRFPLLLGCQLLPGGCRRRCAQLPRLGAGGGKLRGSCAPGACAGARGSRSGAAAGWRPGEGGCQCSCAFPASCIIARNQQAPFSAAAGCLTPHATALHSPSAAARRCCRSSDSCCRRACSCWRVTATCGSHHPAAQARHHTHNRQVGARAAGVLAAAVEFRLRAAASSSRAGGEPPPAWPAAPAAPPSRRRAWPRRP